MRRISTEWKKDSDPIPKLSKKLEANDIEECIVTAIYNFTRFDEKYDG